MAQVIKKYAPGGEITYTDNPPIKVYGVFYDPDELMRNISKSLNEDLNMRGLSGTYRDRYKQQVLNQAKGLIEGSIRLENDGRFYSDSPEFGTTTSNFSKGHRFDKGSSKNATEKEIANDVKLDANRFLYRGFADGKFNSYNTPKKYTFDINQAILDKLGSIENFISLDEIDNKTGLKKTDNRIAFLTNLGIEEQNKLRSNIPYRRKFSYHGGTNEDIASGWSTRYEKEIANINNLVKSLSEGLTNEELSNLSGNYPNLGLLLDNGKDSDSYKAFIAKQQQKETQEKQKQEAEKAANNKYINSFLYFPGSPYKQSYLSYNNDIYNYDNLNDLYNTNAEIKTILDSYRDANTELIKLSDENQNKFHAQYGVDLTDLFNDIRRSDYKIVKAWNDDIFNSDNGKFYIVDKEGNILKGTLTYNNTSETFDFVTDDSTISLGKMSSSLSNPHAKKVVIPKGQYGLTVIPVEEPIAKESKSSRNPVASLSKEKNEQEEQETGFKITDSDKLRLGSAMVDVASAALGFVPGANIGSFVAGVGSTLGELVADIDDAVYHRPNSQGLLSIAGETALNLGMDAISLVPTGKTVKSVSALRKISKYVPYLMTSVQASKAIFSSDERQSIISTLDKINKFNFSELDTKDYQNIAFLGRTLLAGKKIKETVGTRKSNVKQDIDEVSAKYKLTNGKEIEVKTDVDNTKYARFKFFNKNKIQDNALTSKLKSEVESSVRPEIETRLKNENNKLTEGKLSDSELQVKIDNEVNTKVKELIGDNPTFIDKSSSTKYTTYSDSENLDIPKGSDLWFAKRFKFADNYYGKGYYQPKPENKSIKQTSKETSNQVELKNKSVELSKEELSKILSRIPKSQRTKQSIEKIQDKYKVLSENKGKEKALAEVQKWVNKKIIKNKKFKQGGNIPKYQYPFAPLPKYSLPVFEQDKFDLSKALSIPESDILTAPLAHKPISEMSIAEKAAYKAAYNNNKSSAAAKKLFSEYYEYKQKVEDSGGGQSNKSIEFKPSYSDILDNLSVGLNALGNYSQYKTLKEGLEYYKPTAPDLGHIAVIGDYTSSQAGENAAKTLTNQAERMANSTSDARLGNATVLEGITKGNQYRLQGINADVAARRQSRAASDELRRKQSLVNNETLNQSEQNRVAFNNMLTQAKTNYIATQYQNAQRYIDEKRNRFRGLENYTKDLLYKQKVGNLQKQAESQLSNTIGSYLNQAKNYFNDNNIDISGLSNDQITSKYMTESSEGKNIMQKINKNIEDTYMPLFTNLAIDNYKPKTIFDWFPTKTTTYDGGTIVVRKKGGTLKNKEKIQRLKDYNKYKIEAMKENSKTFRESNREFNKTYRALSAGTLKLLQEAIN